MAYGYVWLMSQITTDAGALAVHLDIAEKAVVDVGCGQGKMVRWLRSEGASPVGVECGAEALATARAADPEHADDYLDGEGQNLPLEDESADIVTFFRSLHHVPEGEMTNALAEAFRVLKPGGIAYVVEPVPAGPSFEVVRLIDDETYVRGLAQDALGGAGSIGFERSRDTSYITQSVFADIQHWEETMIGVDSGRRTAVEKMREQIAERFYEHGAKTDDGWAFTSEQLVSVLTKPLAG